MTSGGFYGALNLSYNTAPLLADAERLPRLGEYRNGPLADQIFQVVPWRKAIRELVKSGHLPLMNRFSRGGDPLLAGSQPAPFDPKVWLGFLLPLATAVTFACAFVFFQAAFFTFLFIRDLGVSVTGALMSGAVFMTCGFLDFYITWSLASVVVTLPLLLLGLRRVARDERCGAPVALCAWLLALVGGHPESVLHVTTIGGIFFLWELRQSPDRRRALISAVLTGLLALALAAPVVLPFLEVLPQTSDYQLRKHQHPPQSLPWSEFASSSLGALYPHGWGEPWRSGRADLPSRFNAASGAFIGALALAFAIVGSLFGSGRGARRIASARGAASGGLIEGARSTRLFFSILALSTFSVAMGMPYIADWLAKLPLFSMALNGRLVFVTAFALAVLAGLGFDLLRLEPTPRRLGTVLAVALACGVGGFQRLGSMAALDLPTTGHMAALPWIFAAPVVVVISALMSRSPRLLAALWLGIFLFSHRAELPRFYESIDRALFYPPVPELAVLPQDGEPYRVIGRHFDLVPGQSALFELEDMRGPAVMNHRRLAHLSKAWCVPLHAWFCRVDDTGSSLLDLFNVRFAVGDPATPPPADWPLITSGRQLAIYENPDVLPRAFVPRHLKWVRPSFPVADWVREASDFQGLAWIENPSRQPGETKNGEATVKTRSDGPDLWLQVEAKEKAWVVISQTFWPGWRAVTADGRPLPLLPADHAFMALEAPAGGSEIRLFYRPRGWDYGLGVSAVAMLLCLLFLTWSDVSKRRRQAAAVSVLPGERRLSVGPPCELTATMENAVDLSVIIPAFNEEHRLPPSLRSAVDYLAGSSFEILVVDDGSSDATSEVAADFPGVRVLRLERNLGKGAALRHGVLASRGRRLLLSDADASIPIEQIERLSSSGAPIVIASRAAEGAVADREQIWLRRAMGKTFNRLLRLCGVVDDIGDTQCGFKLFDGEVARALFRQSITRGFAFDVEILWLARRQGIEVSEVGVHWCDQPASSVRPWLDPLRMLIEIVRFSWYHRWRGGSAAGYSNQPAANL